MSMYSSASQYTPFTATGSRSRLKAGIPLANTPFPVLAKRVRSLFPWFAVRTSLSPWPRNGPMVTSTGSLPIPLISSFTATLEKGFWMLSLAM